MQATETEGVFGENGAVVSDTAASPTATPPAITTKSMKPAAIIGTLIAAALVGVAIAVSLIPHKVDYTTEYLNQATMEEIATPTTATANVGDTVTVAAADINGYRLNGQVEQSITLQENAENTIAFMYAKEVSYTVEYLDQDGKAVSPAKVVEKRLVGENITEKAPEFDNYELTSSDAFKTTLKEDEAANSITFTYAKRVNYTVRCVDSDGNELSLTSSEGLVGQKVTEEPQPINGYDLVSTESQAITLAEDEGANVITFIYQREPQIEYTQPERPTPRSGYDLKPIPG